VTGAHDVNEIGRIRPRLAACLERMIEQSGPCRSINLSAVDAVQSQQSRGGGILLWAFYFERLLRGQVLKLLRS
jgi:hypothetical protein